MSATSEPMDHGVESALTGRAITIIPTAALREPTTDTVVLARPAAEAGHATGTLYPMLRQVDEHAPDSSSVLAASFSVVELVDDSNSFAEVLHTLRLVDPAPMFAAAGWIVPVRAGLASFAENTSWARLENISGLILGVSTLRDELLLLHITSQVNSSNAADSLARTWDGTNFTEPP